MPNHEIGSVWRKWDLHVHTPASIVQGYGGDTVKAWNKFIEELEALPQEFAVLGINDYLFIDGYRKLLAVKEEGRLQNIETLLPVVEFRLKKFAGHDKMLRLNYHIIFSENLDPEIIENQFLVQLKNDLNLSPEYASLEKEWQAVVTRDSLEDLGRRIRDTMPPEQAEKVDETDLVLGFNNLNLNEDVLCRILENSYLRGQYLTAIGKAEWDQYRWNDHSIADKKNTINSVDIVFTAAPDLPAFERGRQRLVTEGVKSTLFDCSDAHAYVDSNDKDRIGNCMTWVKGDTTLDGLVLAVKDYPERVFVGTRPPLLEEIDRRPAKFIRRVLIDKQAESTLGGKWFDKVNLPLNPELVAVIGNRGMGKSALLDSIALAGNAPRPSNELSFLKQFQIAPFNLADKFEVVLQWYTPEPEHPTLLSATFDNALPSRVRHLPQHFIEQICNEEHDQFITEIERVVFSHVSEEERLGLDSLSRLIDFRMEATKQEAADIRSEISILNSRIADLEHDLSPAHCSQIGRLLKQKLDELRGMWGKRPTVPPMPESSDPELEAIIGELKDQIKDLSSEKGTTEKRALVARAALESARRIIALLDKIERDISRLSVEHSDDFSKLGITLDQVVSLELKRDLVQGKERTLVQELSALRKELDEDQEGSLSSKFVAAMDELRAVEETLSAPMQVYQAAKKARLEFRQSICEVIGTSETPDSIRYLKAQHARLENDAPAELAKLKSERINKAKKLFEKLFGQVALLHELYTPVREFINTYPPSDEAFRIDFTASLVAEGFTEGFFSHVANNKRGSFYGAEQGTSRAIKVQNNTNFKDWESVAIFLERIDEAMHHDMRPNENNAARQPSEQLRQETTVADLYDFIYQLEYIHYRHHLTIGGRTLGELSPGEKGALLLAFYLLVDRSECPLLIDQPEENLDNQSVYKVLVPFIKEARKRRQVLLVTHNPNIAVVAGAEQIVFCVMDKADEHRLIYTAGALENPQINKHVLDVLEGTRPAFTSRDETYRVSANPRRVR